MLEAGKDEQQWLVDVVDAISSENRAANRAPMIFICAML